MVREFSAGGIVLRKLRGRWNIAVIEPHMSRPKKSAKSSAKPPKQSAAAEVIALPKGAIDKGEKPEQTALREVNEETGLTADLVAKLADIKYVYVRNGATAPGSSRSSASTCCSTAPAAWTTFRPDMRIEVQKAYWLSLDQAPQALSYKGEREVAELALKYVNAHPELGDHAANSAH